MLAGDESPGQTAEQNAEHAGRDSLASVDALLRSEGFVLFNQRGSHCTYHRADGRVLTIVKPHGKRKTCSPSDIRKLLEALGL